MAMVLLLHILVVSLAVLFASIGVRTNMKRGNVFKWNSGYFFSFLLLVLFLGFRVSLGRDWNNYERIYTSIFQQEFVFGESREIGFLSLVGFLRACGFEFQAFIFSSSFLMLFLFYMSYRKFYYLLPFGIFVFFTDWGYPVTINTIRQGIALMAFLNATLFIDSMEKHAGRKFLFFMLVGSLFHYSILIFFPFYYIGRLKLNIMQFLVACVVLIVVSIFLVIPVYGEVMMLADKYEGYANESSIVNEESSFGLGATLVLLIRAAPIIAYSFVKNNYPGMLKYFVMYFLGICIYYGFYEYLLITRVSFYLQFLELFVQSFFLYYLFMRKIKYRLLGFIYVFFILFNYIYLFNDFLVDQVSSTRFSLMFFDFYFKSYSL